MVERGGAPAADMGVKPEKATETLSQFIARVLDQLSLSAWLPSVALVLAGVFIFQIAAVLDDKAKPGGPGEAVGRALAAIAKTSLGGAILLLAAVVVFTMLTQAFAFEAIRILEGYWGTGRIVEWLARLRCGSFRKRRKSYDARWQELTEQAWIQARIAIEREQSVARERNNADAEVLEWTPDMLAYLDARLRGRKPVVQLERDARLRARDLPWQRFAPPDLLRRQINVDKRRRDFPQPERILPTWLGNILRTHEDQTGRERVETMIQEIDHVLPSSLRNQHTEQRNRLDLYCSMVFVLALVSAIGAARLSRHHLPYALTTVAVSFIGMWIAYRAALASARAYGLLLVTISRLYPPSESQREV